MSSPGRCQRITRRATGMARAAMPDSHTGAASVATAATRRSVAARCSAMVPPIDWPATMTSSHSRASASSSSLRGACPVVPRRGLERLRGGAVPGQGRTAAAVAIGREVLAEAAQLGWRPGEAVEEEHAATSLAERPRAHHVGVERVQAARGHGRPSICAARGCYRRALVTDEVMRGALETIVGGGCLDVATRARGHGPGDGGRAPPRRRWAPCSRRCAREARPSTSSPAW